MVEDDDVGDQLRLAPDLRDQLQPRQAQRRAARNARFSTECNCYRYTSPVRALR